MVKTGFQAMRAVQEFTVQEKLAEIEGWVMSGASKRGWTAFLSGAVRCDTCAAKIIAVAPLVPIVPNLKAEVHRMWQSYNGFTWAFSDYIAANLTWEMDGEEMAEIFKTVDPINYFDRLADIPKYIVVSSDDEFMSMDWSNMYYDKL
jgi:PhoPQ-activated pathogenicity-related protein